MLIKILCLGTFVCCTFFACSKKNNPAPAKATTWNVGGNNYTGTTTAFNKNVLVAYDSKLTPIISISIGFSARPVAGTYTVVNPYASVIFSGQCYIEENLDGGLYTDSGGQVTVTVNNDKITATFSNITMSTQTGFNPNTGYTFAVATTTSGALIEN
jgi:hypothetical protein